MKRMFMLCVAVSFFSCQKLLDRFETHNPPQEADCQINEITFQRVFDGVPSKKTMRFHYLEQGNPEWVELLYENQQDADYGGELYFTYDEKNRLTGFEVNGLSNTTYAYEGDADLPVRDTTTTYFLPVYVEDLSYDAKGRLIKLEGRFHEDHWGNENYPLEYTIDYNYDERGNLVTEGYTYDSTKSLLSTNKIFMLAGRNWSANNRYPATSTNEHGWPTKFSYGEFLGHMDPDMTIEYECK